MPASTSPPPPGTNPIDAARTVADHALRLARLELELRTLVLRRKATAFGIGAALGLAAALLAVLAVIFLLAAATAALATAVSVWLAILIVAAALILLVAALAGTAVLLTKRALGKGATDGEG